MYLAGIECSIYPSVLWQKSGDGEVEMQCVAVRNEWVCLERHKQDDWSLSGDKSKSLKFLSIENLFKGKFWS